MAQTLEYPSSQLYELSSTVAAAAFQEIYEGLGENVKVFWRDSVVLGSPHFVF